MKEKFSHANIGKAPFAYAYHKIITDKKGKPVDYEFLEVNKAFEKITGLKASDVIGKTVKKVLPGIEKSVFDWITFYGKIALKGGHEEFEQYSEPLKRWYKVQAYSPEKNHFAVFFTDITLNKKQEQILFDINERLTITLNSIGDAVIVTDTKSRITQMNPVAERLTGWNIKDAMNEKIEKVFKIVNAKTGKRVESPVNLVIKTGVVSGLANHTKLISKTGDEYQIADSGSPIRDADGKLFGVVIIFRDVTEDYNLRKTLKLSEKRFRRVSSTITDIIYSCVANKKGNFALDWITGATEQICGYTVDEIISKKCWKFLVLKEDISIFEKYVTGLKSGKHASCEFRIKHKNGNIIWVESHAECILSLGKPTLYGGLTDVTERIIAQESLLESETRLKRAVANSPVPIMLHDEDDKVLLLSKGWTDFSGYTIKDIPTLADWTEKAYGKRTGFEKEYIDNLFKINKTEYNGEWTVTAKNGSKRIWEFQTTPLGAISSGRRVLHSMAIDITESKKAKDELIQSEKKYRDMIMNLMEGFFNVSLEGILLDYNSEFINILKLDPSEDHTGKPLINFWQNIDDRKKYVDEILTNGFVKNYQLKGKKSDGTKVDVIVNARLIKDENDEPIRIEGSMLDVTEKIKAENKLKESEETYRNIFQNAQVGLFRTRITDGKILESNEQLAKMFGYKNREELINEYYTSENYVDEGTREKMIKTIKENGYVENFEARFYRKDRSIFWANYSARIYHEKGWIEGVAEDITYRKETEQALLAAKDKAEESDRLKSAFLANMSHEIRTPMNGILGFLELLKSPDLTEENRTKYINIVNKGGERLLNTINDIIEISRIESGQIHLNEDEVNVSEIMNYYLQFFKKQTDEAGISLSISEQIPTEDSTIKTDKHKLDGILTNLIKNAIKFTKHGSIEFGNYIDGGSLTFFVKDTGAGIPKDRLEAIFERFVQADTNPYTRPYEGSGLGLSIIKAYIDLLKGKVWVKSEIGKGSTFHFSIPYNPIHKEIKISSDSTDSSIAFGNNLKILIAEDDDCSYEYLKNILNKEGITTLHTKNGKDVINTLKTDKEISIILMDIEMPVMNGLDATKIIRSFNEEIPIIAQSAYAMEEDRINALKAGCTDYISKPIKKIDLLSKINTLMKK